MRSQSIDEVSAGACDHLQRALGKRARRHERLGHSHGQHRRRRRGLGDHGHAREPRARGFLGETPGGKIERVDVHRHPAPRDEHVLSAHARGAPEADRLAVAEERRVSERLAQLAVRSERAGGAVDVELRVRAGISRVFHAALDELVALAVNRARQGEQHLSALREGHRAQRSSALARAVRARAAEVQALGRGRRERFFGARVVERLALSFTGHPLAGEIALQRFHLRSLFHFLLQTLCS